MNTDFVVREADRGTMTPHHYLNPRLLARLESVQDLDVHFDVDLAACSRWKIGGRADCVVCPTTTRAIQEVLRIALEEKVPVAVIGLTTNLLFATEGIRALVIHIGQQFAAMSIDGNRVTGQAGVWIPGFARRVAKRGLSGVEHLAGIPGTLGGLVCMNGGSQRRGIGDHLTWVKALDPQGEEHTFGHEECGFAYRCSVFQQNRYIICEAAFQYEPVADSWPVRREMKRILEDRRRKFPQKLPNCGSVFVSDPALYDSFGPPGAVIEKCGLKGVAKGGARISPMHANFIVNTGHASAEDVLYLIDLVRTKVKQVTGCDLQAEAKYVDCLGQFTAAHLVAQQWVNNVRVGIDHEGVPALAEKE